MKVCYLCLINKLRKNTKTQVKFISKKRYLKIITIISSFINSNVNKTL